MKTYNVLYKDMKQFTEYVSQQGRNLIGQILVQIFTGNCNYTYIKKLVGEIKSVLPKAKIIGCTSAGEIIDGCSMTNTTVISITTFQKTWIKAHSVNYKNTSKYSGARILAESIITKQSKALIMFASGSSDIDGNLLLQGIESVKKSIIIAGGVAGGSSLSNKRYVFDENHIYEEGIVAVSLNSDSLYVHTDSSFSWVPIGREMTITKSQGNIIYEIENTPAKRFYLNHIGQNFEDYSDIGIKFPLALERNGRYVTHPIISLSDTDELVLAAHVKNGEKIRLGYGNLVDILNGARNTHKKIVNKPIESLFVYSCSGRITLLKELIDYELKPLSYEISVGGCYTYGEFSYIDGTNTLYMQTSTFLGLSEDINARIKIDNTILTEKKFFKNVEESVLHHLIKTTSQELNQLNNELEKKVFEKTKELQELYYTDDITGLPNKNRLKYDIENGRINKLSVLDIKAFSNINNFYGNDIGDILLRQVGMFLTQQLKRHGLVCYQMDTCLFAIIASDCCEDRAFIDLCQDLQHQLKEKTFIIHDYHIIIETTVGIVIDQNKLIEKAGIILDYAKKQGLPLQLYTDDLELVENIRTNLEMATRIRNAISENRIVPYFQPIIDNQTRKIVKYESLIRMIDEEGNLISPYLFLTVAKKAGYYPELTRIMLKKTFEKFSKEYYDFSINVLISDIVNKKTRQYIYTLLEDKQVAERAIFEIVESEGIEEFDEVMTFINEVKSRGAKIAIDDFGSGYSNFMYLTQLMVDIIKIDGSIIKHINDDKKSQIIAETIVSFAKKLGVETVAEYVHNGDVYDVVGELGVNYSQGFYFSKPKETL